MNNLKARIIASIAVIYLARHGKAGAAAAGRPDSERQLNETGTRQAHGLRQSIERLSPDGFDIIGSSPLDRAMKTTEIVTGILPTPFPAFGVSDDKGDPLNVMFAELAYAPLYANSPDKPSYLAHTLAQHLHDWAENAVESLVVAAEEHKRQTGQRANMFVGGHAVMQPMVALKLAEALGGGADQAPDFIRFENMGEAETICLQVSDDGQFEFAHIKPDTDVVMHATAGVTAVAD